MFVLAAGNLFTGSFNYASMTGTVKFGSKYTYTARPKALRVKYHATTGDIDIVRSQNPAPGVAKGDPDKCRIFVAIVDWSQPHTVVREPARPREPGIRPTERTRIGSR